MTTPALELRDLAVAFGGVRAVDGLSLRLAPATLTGLVGPNGSGKSTTINAITGVVPVTSGQVVVAGDDMTGRRADEIARAGVRRTFQLIRLVPSISVLENVMVGADDGTRMLDNLFRPGRARSRGRESRERAMAALERVGLVDVARKRPTELPYGHQRRVEIARALASDPSVLLLDEPVAGMAGGERHEVAELIGRLSDEGVTQLLVEHDLEFVTSMCHDLVVMDFGQIIAQGDPLTTAKDEKVKEAYLGHKTTAADG